MDGIFPRGSTAGLVTARRPVHLIVCTDYRRQGEDFNLIWWGIWCSGAVDFFKHCWKTRERLRTKRLGGDDFDWMEYG